MREKLLKLWRGRPRLGRRGRIVVDLLASVLAACLLWAAAGFPLPTAELEFRRMERTHLMPRSEIVFTNGAGNGDTLWLSRGDSFSGWSVFALDGTELHLQGRWVAGTREERAVLARLDGNFSVSFIRASSLDGGPALAPLARSDRYLHHNGYWVSRGPGETPEGHPAYGYEYHNFSAFLLFGAPEGTARAELTVRDGGVERAGGGWALENGLWLLGVEDGPARELVSEIPYTLRLYDASDTLLAERSGRLWEK